MKTYYGLTIAWSVSRGEERKLGGGGTSNVLLVCGIWGLVYSLGLQNLWGWANYSLGLQNLWGWANYSLGLQNLWGWANYSLGLQNLWGLANYSLGLQNLWGLANYSLGLQNLWGWANYSLGYKTCGVWQTTVWDYKTCGVAMFKVNTLIIFDAWTHDSFGNSSLGVSRLKSSHACALLFLLRQSDCSILDS